METDACRGLLLRDWADALFCSESCYVGELWDECLSGGSLALNVSVRATAFADANKAVNLSRAARDWGRWRM